MSQIKIRNKKAAFEFAFLSKYEAGIQLTGTEVKSLRAGNANFNDAYCLFFKDELYLKKMYIAIYEPGSSSNHVPIRDRKLLLKNAELKKLQKKIKEKGLTIVPVQLYFNERGLVKLEIALAKGKKEFDKRESIKEKDSKRDLDRERKIAQNEK